jgi:multiple sugar transport system substrate-binding protein
LGTKRIGTRTGTPHNSLTRRQISRRTFLRGAAIAGAAGGLLPFAVACRGSAAKSGPGDPADSSRTTAIDSVELTGRRTEVSFWHTQTGPKAAKLNAIVDAFNRSQTSVAVKAEYQGDYSALFKKLLAGVAAHQTPDLAVSYPSMVSEYQSAGAMVALDPYIRSARYGLSKSEQDDYIQPYWNEGKYPEYGNQMLSFPFTKSLLVLYYNADKLKEARIEKPPADWTWGDFASACKRVTTGRTRGWAIAVSASTFDGMVYSRGGKLISENQKHWLFDDQAGTDSLLLYQTAVREGWGNVVSQANGDQSDFADGNAAFALSSSSGFPFYKDAVDNGAQFKWSVATIPHGDGVAPATVLYGGSLAVFRGVPEKQLAAWLFLKYFSSPDVTADWSTATGYMPVRTSAIGSELVQAAMRASGPYGVVVADIARYGRAETSVRGTEDTRGFIEDAITAAVSDPSTNPKQALQRAAEKGDRALLG